METNVRQIAEELTEALEREGKAIPASVSKHFWRLVGQMEVMHRQQQSHSELLTAHGQSLTRVEKSLFGDKDDVEAHPGIVHELAAIRRGSKQNRKLLWYAATVLTGMVVKALWAMLMHSGALKLP